MDEQAATGAGSRSPTLQSFELHPRPPYRLDLTVWALRRRRRNEIDRWDGSYRRALLVGDRPVAVRADQLGSANQPVVRVEITGHGPFSAAELAEAEAQVVRLLGVEVGLDPFYDLADAHPLTRRVKDRFLGMRPPRYPSLWEALVNAVANQQISLEVGLTLLNRLTATLGVAAPGDDGLVAFPTPDAVLATGPETLRGLGFSTRKAEYLHTIADAVVTGDLDEVELGAASRTDATRHLTGLRGVGRWTAEYTLLRGLGRLDVYPGDDVGARNKLRRFFGLDHDPDYDQVSALLRPWEPYTGLIYFHLLLDGLTERGQIDL